MAEQPLLNGFANSAHDVMMGPAHESAEIFGDQIVLETVTEVLAAGLGAR